MGKTIKLANDTYLDPATIMFNKGYPSDLDNCFTNGVYPYFPQTLNRPTNLVEYGIVIVIENFSTNWIYQIGIGNWDNPRISSRCYVNNVWTNWE